MTSGLEGITLPARWRWSQLRHLTTVLRRGTAPDYADDGPVRVVGQAANQWKGIDWNRTRFHAQHGDPRRLKGFLRAGDVLVNSTGTGTLGRIGYFEVGPDAQACIADGHITVVRASSDELDSRFAYYFMSSSPFQHFMTSALVAGATNQIELSVDRMGASPVPLPPFFEQRRIAGFLDKELLLISRARSVTEKQVRSLEERSSALFGDSVLGWGGPALDRLDLPRGVLGNGWKAAPLSKLLRELTNGYVGPTRDLLVSDGVRYLQSLHIRRGKIDFDRRPYFVPKHWVDERPRIRLQSGDLLLVQTGALGEVAVVGPEFEGSSCHALLIARPHAELVSSRYLGLLFRSNWGMNALLRERTGALHPHLEAGKVREIVVPFPARKVQEKIASTVSAEELRIELLQERLERKVALLEERRQALITAAVTGQIDVTTARGVA